jgi:hypothetical protein
MSALEDASGLAALFGKGAPRGTRSWCTVRPAPSASTSRTGEFARLLFRPAKDLATGRTLVVVNGSDGSLASLWARAAAPALARGYNVLLFDGPGQQSQLFERNVPFRPDWEAVLTPVYDDISRRHDVDPARIGLYGISQGGYWVARALAFEHRYAAAIVDPGVVDVSTSWTGHIPASLMKHLDAGRTRSSTRRCAFGCRSRRDRAHLAVPRSPLRCGWLRRDDRGRAHVHRRRSRLAHHNIAADYFSRGEQFWPGQSEQLASLTPNVSTLVPFTAAEGADGHCQPLARDLATRLRLDGHRAR